MKRLGPVYRMMPLLMLERSGRPFQSRWSYWRGKLQNLNFALFGFTTYRIKRRLGLSLAPKVHEGEVKRDQG